MDIEVSEGNSTYVFTLRSNAKEVRLDLTNYYDDNVQWSALEEQCKIEEKRKLIDIPNSISQKASQELLKALTITNRI